MYLLIWKVTASVNRTVARGRRIDKCLLQGWLLSCLLLQIIKSSSIYNRKKSCAGSD